MVILRKYQEEAVNSVLKSWEADEKPLVVVATGGGKTKILTQVLIQVDHVRALVIAHTHEIISQISNELKKNFSVGIVMGKHNDTTSPMIVASRQSLIYRLSMILKHGAIDIVVIDEAHHAQKKNTYGYIIQRLRAKNKNLKIVGFTATPKRENMSLFDKISFSWSIKNGINSGYLVPPILLKIHKTGKIDVGHAITAFEKYIFPFGRKCIAFFPSVLLSKQFTKKMRRLSYKAAHLDANTSKNDRSSILSDYASGKIDILSNMAVLTEGFDSPETSAILIVRPTQSVRLLTQIIGRGLRKYSRKKNCIIITIEYDE